MADLGFADDLHGVTCPSLDRYVREYADDYRGGGPAMVINEGAIRECSHPNDVEYIILATVLHELAHILERPTHYAERTADVDSMRIKFDALTIAHATRQPWPVDVPAYHGHDQVFICTCLHLAYRAQQAGVAICPNVFCAGRGYGLYPATSYQRALGDEPAQLRHLKFQEILTIEPPAAFTALWQDDVKRHHQLYLPPQGVET